MKYRFENISVDQDRIRISGFIAGDTPESDFTIALVDEHNKDIPFKLSRLRRNDVSVKYFKTMSVIDHGFSLSFSARYSFSLLVTIDHSVHRIRLNPLTIAYHNGMQSLRNNRYLQMVKQRLTHGAKPVDYMSWLKKHSLNEEEYTRQKNTEWSEDAPLFSIIIPLYATPERYLRELIDSIEKQTYGKYEVCFADGSPKEKSLEQIVSEYQKTNHRIRYQFLNENRGISGNTNAAVEMASGDFIVLCDHDDLLTHDALYELAKAVKENPECDCIYSDEDKIDETSTKYFDPHFKPDYNIDLLTSNNYICHIYAVRKSIVEKTGGFDEQYDGAQDHDFIMRTTEQARSIVHIPKVLYHWRTHMNSTSVNPESKMYAFEAGKKAIKAHYERVWPELKVDHVEDGASLGIYHTVFDVKEELVSVIIPNKDHTEDLDKAIRSMIEKGTWKNLEFIIVENNSEKKETFEYYDRIQKEYEHVKVVYYKGGFNYSAINNFGVKYAKGKYLLLMNNDVELIEPDSLKEMMGYCVRDDVGIVGCRLLYPDNSIQHAGVVIGIGVAEHILKNTYSGDGSYFNRSMTIQDLSAVTAAVMLVKREVYESVRGLDESFAVAFNDIDFCLRVRNEGKLVVYQPYACFHHYESKSRGLDDNAEKMARYMDEMERFTNRWKTYFEKGDPMYNINLTHQNGSCSLSDE